LLFAASGLTILLKTKCEATVNCQGAVSGINEAKKGALAIGDLVNAFYTSDGFLVMNAVLSL